MLPELLKSSNKKILISTGNILNVNKKTGQKPTEELYDCLHVTLDEANTNINDDTGTGEICRSSDDLQEKISEHERDSIKIGAKVFLNDNSHEYLDEAVTTILRILNVKFLDNLILAYHPKKSYNYDNGGGNDEAEGGDDIIDGRNDENHQKNDGQIEQQQKDGVLDWGGGKPAEALQDLKFLWKNLENYAAKKLICQLGISDLDVDTLRDLYAGSVIHPTITQINLSACCVVPPPLQEFCNQNDVQLLTHSDPEVILSEESLSKLGLNGFIPTWTVRYQVHVKCRGLLTAKGYIVGARRKGNLSTLENGRTNVEK